MKPRITDLDDPQWQLLFRAVRSSWFRLETLQAYDVEYEAEAFSSFQRTGHFDREPQQWQQMITAHVQAGRSLQRVHIIEEPLTDYLRYEFAAYELNAQAGEEIRLIPVTDGHWPSDLPKGTDYWLFDDKAAWTMQYDEQGRFIAAEKLQDPGEIQQCKQWRTAALAQSTALTDYLRRAA